MPSGMMMLLKAMGFNPAEMQAQALAAVQYCNQQQKYFDDKINIIIANQINIADAINKGTRCDIITPDGFDRIKSLNGRGGH